MWRNIWCANAFCKFFCWIHPNNLMVSIIYTVAPFQFVVRYSLATWQNNIRLVSHTQIVNEPIREWEELLSCFCWRGLAIIELCWVRGKILGDLEREPQKAQFDQRKRLPQVIHFHFGLGFVLSSYILFLQGRSLVSEFTNHNRNKERSWG